MRYFKFSVTMLVLLMLAAVLTVGVGAVGKTAPRIAFMDGTAEVSAVETLSAGTLTMPDHTPADGGKLVGWQATVDGATVFLPVGASYAYAQDAAVTFTAVTLHMTTAAAATPRFDETGLGLRFTTTAAKQEMALLKALSPALQMGTLITPNKNAKAAALFTHAGLEAAGLKYLDVIAADYYRTDAECVTFAGSVHRLRFENYTLGYAAVGYVKVCYTDGTTACFYAAQEKNFLSSVTPWQIAYAAMRDTEPTASDRCPNAFGTVFSPYTDAQRAQLRPIFAGVVALEVSEKAPGGKVLDRDIEAFGQLVYSEQVVRENDAAWENIRRFIDVSKYECALVITPPAGTVLNADTLAGVVLSLAGLPGITVTYVMGDGCVILPFSNYSDNY